jgi:hypothetical protein
MGDQTQGKAGASGNAGGGGPSRRDFIKGVGAAAAIAATAQPAAAASPWAVPGSLNPPLYRIHPAIGFARVGNADPSTFYIGPEVPGYTALPDSPATGQQAVGTAVPNYKDSNGLVKPQAARFRIFEYGMLNNRLVPLREVNLNTAGIQSISWNVHIANKKASFHLENGSAGDSTSGYPLPSIGYRNPSVANRASLENDYGSRTISGALAAPVNIAPGMGNDVSVVKGSDGVTPVISYMGQLRTDAAGRLLVLGGKGVAASNANPAPAFTHWANNDTWFDDVGDGPVTATVTLSNNQQVSMNGTDPNGKPFVGSAWVMTTVPHFAPGQMAAVSLYDLFVDVAVRSLAIPPLNGLYDAGGPLARVVALKADLQVGAAVELPTYVPDWPTEVYPMLLAAYNYRWTTELVNNKMDSLMDPTLSDPSGAAAAARGGVWQYIREPIGAMSFPGNRDMPRLRGDDPYQGQSIAHYMFAQAGQGVTKGGDPNAPSAADIASNIRSLPVLHTQFAIYQKWASGVFGNSGWTLPPPAITPHGLDRAALENCIGGAFGPGLEMGWQIRNPLLFSEPFRLNPNATSQYLDQNGNPEGTPIGPGHFSRQQALPWHCDFNACRSEGSYGWWPSGRPTAVLLHPTDSLTQRVDWARPDKKFPGGNTQSGYQDMVSFWWKFGFVEPVGGAYVETERAASVP